jgi:hypothetical protein
MVSVNSGWGLTPTGVNAGHHARYPNRTMPNWLHLLTNLVYHLKASLVAALVAMLIS